MKLRIRNGRARLAQEPRPDGPGGKVRVKNKETGKSTFVSPKTLQDHPERYEGPGQRGRDQAKQKSNKKERAKARQKEKERRKQLKQKGKQELERRDKEQKWKAVENDHPELSPREQEERKKTFMETGVDSGGRSTKAIKWWLQHHGVAPDEKPPDQPRKLDKKSIQEHFKYGPKPNKKGQCSEGLKAVKIKGGGGQSFTICVDPNVYDMGK